MTTTTEKAAPKAKAKTTKTAAPEVDAFGIANLEVPAAMRDIAEKSVNQAKEAYDKIKSATEEATDMIEDSYETTRQNVVEFNKKAIDVAMANTNATFEFMKDLMAAKSMADAVELQTGFTRKQFEALSAQSKDLQELATKAATDATQPIKDAVEKTLKDIKAA